MLFIALKLLLSDYLQIMNAAKVEYILLDQVRIVGLGQKIIVWMSPKLSITLTAGNAFGTYFCRKLI